MAARLHTAAALSRRVHRHDDGRLGAYAVLVRVVLEHAVLEHAASGRVVLGCLVPGRALSRPAAV